MTYLLKIEQYLYNLLQEKSGLEVYTHIPDDPSFPLLKIGDMECKEWLVTPKSYVFEFSILAYSSKTSNTEVIQIINNVSALSITELRNATALGITGVIESGLSIYQLKNYVWCAELKLKINCIEWVNYV